MGKSSLRQWKQLAIAAQDFDCVDGPFDSEFVPEHDESLNLQGSNEVKNGNESISSKVDNVEAEFYEEKEERSLFSGTKEEGFNSDVQCQNHGRPSCYSFSLLKSWLLLIFPISYSFV